MPTKPFVPSNCLICQGKGLNGKKCIFCGFKPKSKSGKKPLYQMSKEEQHKIHCEKVRLVYLKELWDKLRKFQQTSTGIEAVDNEVREAFGDWTYSWF